MNDFHYQAINENGNTVTGVVKDYYFQSLHHSMEPLAIFSVPEWYSYIFVRIN